MSDEVEREVWGVWDDANRDRVSQLLGSPGSPHNARPAAYLTRDAAETAASRHLANPRVGNRLRVEPIELIRQ